MDRKSNRFGLDSEWVVILNSQLSFIRWSKLRDSVGPGWEACFQPCSASFTFLLRIMRCVDSFVSNVSL